MRVSRLHDSLGDLADPQVGESDDGRDGVDHRKEYPLGAAHSEEDQGGNEVHKGGQDLHGVENRTDAPLEAIAEGSGYADRYTKSYGDDH